MVDIAFREEKSLHKKNTQVSVISADKGDIVLVVWSEEHTNYQIYHEVSLHILLGFYIRNTHS